MYLYFLWIRAFQPAVGLSAASPHSIPGYPLLSLMRKAVETVFDFLSESSSCCFLPICRLIACSVWLTFFYGKGLRESEKKEFRAKTLCLEKNNDGRPRCPQHFFHPKLFVFFLPLPVMAVKRLRNSDGAEIPLKKKVVSRRRTSKETWNKKVYKSSWSINLKKLNP